MENVVIYEDDETRIEIAGWFHYYLTHIHVPSLRLEDKHLEALLPFVNTRLINYDRRKYFTKYWGKAPIFQFDRFIHFEPPFDVFMDAQACVSSCPHNIAEDPKAFEESLDELYSSKEGEHFIVHIFYEKIHEIQGFFAYVNDSTKEILIMFWGYQPPNKEDLIESV